MKCFHSISLGWGCGSFDGLFNEAKVIAVSNSCKVNFEFNGVKVNITEFSTLQVTGERVQSAIQNKQISAFGEET